MKLKIISLASLIVLTVAIHYGWVLEPIFGNAHWIHSIHSRFCYIPIVVAASLFGIRGGLITATIISISVLPYLFDANLSEQYFYGEIVEIVFYYALAVLIGAIIERVLIQREKHKETQLQLERTYRLSLMGQMAATMAHEIKNPLASIKGSVEILCNPNTNNTNKKEFETIVLQEIKRVDNTIKEYLKFARPKPIEFKKINLSDAIRVTVKQVENQAAESNIKILNKFPKNISINGDAVKIHQVLLNLFLNALEASPSNNKISISGKISQQEVVINFKDNGNGIPSTEIKKIFDPFYTTKQTGTGLGLAVVKSIITGHNGSISVESKPNDGTTFRMSLPLYLEEQND